MSFMLLTWTGVAFSIKGSLLVVPAVIIWLAAFVSMVAANACLKCTQCGSWLHRAKGDFCPECGSRGLSEGDWWRPRWCAGCGLELRYHKGGRKFKVRYCSECGSHLDEEGL